VDERKAFLLGYKRGEVSFSALCRQYNISRPTGYKWLERFQEEGESGLHDQSRAPLHPARGTPRFIQDRILEVRQAHPSWGPKKLLGWLHRKEPRVAWPAASTVGELLRREGLAHPRPARRRTLPWSQPLAHAQEPNAVWCADFKGWFLCQNGERCDPLTVTDAYSRFLLGCCSVPKTDGPHVRQVLEAAFRRFGLPLAIRTDNGPPFASTGIAGLSRLSVWWVRLGITPERIERGCPQQNGRHERFHLTLKHETASPPRTSLQLQQKTFSAFQNEYNHERPHKALSQRTPAMLYRPSARTFPDQLPELVYPFAVWLRSISAAGHFSWAGHQIYVSVLLQGESVALRPLEDGLFEVLFGPIFLGWFEERSATFTPVASPPRGRT
jgi:transposase InsO family protein